MNIDKEYNDLKNLVLGKIPDTFTLNNNLIEENPYDASFMPINFNPYRQNGCYYPTFCEYTPRVYTGRAPRYKMSKGEETTICMWNGILQYEEYDFLADLLILGFMHDCYEVEFRRYGGASGRRYATRKTSHHSIAGNFYTVDDIFDLMEKARAVLEENHYGKHDPRCKKYLSIYNGETYRRYHNKAWNDELEIKDTADFARIMMEIIVEEYGSKYFIIRCPSEQSIAMASRIQSEATNRFFEEAMMKADKIGKGRNE